MKSILRDQQYMLGVKSLLVIEKVLLMRQQVYLSRYKSTVYGHGSLVYTSSQVCTWIMCISLGTPLVVYRTKPDGRCSRREALTTQSQWCTVNDAQCCHLVKAALGPWHWINGTNRIDGRQSNSACMLYRVRQNKILQSENRDTYIMQEYFYTKLSTLVISADLYLAFVPLWTHVHQSVFRLLSFSKASNLFPDFLQQLFGIQNQVSAMSINPSFIFVRHFTHNQS